MTGASRVPEFDLGDAALPYIRVVTFSRDASGGPLPNAVRQILSDAEVTVTNVPAEVVEAASWADLVVIEADEGSPIGQELFASVTALHDSASVVVVAKDPAAGQGRPGYLIVAPTGEDGVSAALRFGAARSRAASERLRRERLAGDLLDAADMAICAIDGDGVIIAVNRSWLEFAAKNGGLPERTGVGTNYLTVCDQATGAHAEGAAEARRSAGSTYGSRRFPMAGARPSPTST